MSKYEDTISTLVDRIWDERSMNLSDFIAAENLYEYELGYVDIVDTDSLGCVIVPCEDYMILAREYYNEEDKKRCAQYAIYSQHDKDGNNISNSLNLNAVYKFEYVGEEDFTGMAYAIAYAADLIHTITENRKGNEENGY